jgi:signal transduction histidine kinase
MVSNMPTGRRSEWVLLLQATLVALPVAGVAGAAVHFLRSERAEVEQQAREGAGILAPEFARQLASRAGDELSRQVGLAHHGRIAGGRIVSVGGFEDFPSPADWLGKLTARQAQWWETAQNALYRRSDADSGSEALRALAASALDNLNVRANAELGLLELEEYAGAATNWSARAVDLAQRFPNAVTPSGAPVAALALLLALRHTRPGVLSEGLLQEIEQNTADHPSFLTVELLEAARAAAAGGANSNRVAELLELWKRQEENRQQTHDGLERLLRHSIPVDRPGEIWLNEDTGEGAASLLALTNPSRSRGWDVILVPASALVDAARKTLQAVGSSLPEYAGVVMEMGGEAQRVSGQKTTGAGGAVLASAEGMISLSGDHAFQLRLDLSNPGLLYARYRQRQLFLEWLILAATGIAFAGLASLWIGHRRQMRLNEMKTNFVSSVSHELRAPLAAVQLMAESLENGRVSGASRQQDYFRLIVRECRRLSTLVENVLDLARIDQGRQRYHLEPVDPMALLRRTVMLMQANADQRRVRLVLAEPTENPRAAGSASQPRWDSEAVEQSLVNLLDNAIKYSPEGGEVRVEMEACPNAVRLWVRDRGPGIAPSDHEHIFDRFYRRGQELRRETRGVGIGLSIVKHVAEGHSGRVLVESEVGQGSSFGLELPRDSGTPS